MIQDDDQPKAAVAALTRVATPAAHSMLRRFWLSQAGAVIYLYPPTSHYRDPSRAV